MKDPINIHISDIRTYRSCRRKWNWASPLRENLEPSVPYAPFFVGRAIHHCLENYYRSGEPVWDSLDAYLNNESKIAGHMWKSEQDSWNESVALISELLQHYMLWVQVDPSEFRDENLEFISLEQPFNVEMRNPDTHEVDERIRLEGRFDGIVRHAPSDSYWIWECKTTRSIGELARSLDQDEQAGAYIYAAELISGYKISGILYNMLRKKAPTHPHTLQNGLLSQNKAVDATAFSLMMDIKRNHPDWDNMQIQANYGPFLGQFPIGDNGFFARYPIKRSHREIEMLTENLYWTAMEMIDPNIKLYPAPNFVQCNLCMFRAPCIAKSRGGHYKQLLEAEFQTRVKAESFREV